MRDVQIEISSASIMSLSGNLRRKGQNVKVAVNTEMEILVGQLFAEAQQKAPVLTGALAASGHITTHNMDNVIERTIGYGTSLANPQTGKPTSSYAVSKHETYNPDKPESYKWLENTIINNSDTFLQRMANAVAQGLNG